MRWRPCPGHWHIHVFYPSWPPYCPPLFPPSSPFPLGERLVNCGLPLWVIFWTKKLFRGLWWPQQTWTFRSVENLHPTHILKLGQKRRYFGGFYLSLKKADLSRRVWGWGWGVKSSFKACFLFSNLSVVSTHTDTLPIWLQSSGDCERYGWNSAWNQFFFYHYLFETHCSYLHCVLLWHWMLTHTRLW